jgi:hypothetical protein
MDNDHRAPYRACIISFALFVLVSCIGAGSSQAVDVPPASPPPAEAPEPEGQPLEEQIISLGRSMEATHDRLEQDILGQVIRFDDFFGNVKTEELRKTRYQLRWRNSLRLAENGTL